MGEELTDAKMKYAQRLLKAKHPKVNGLRTLYIKEKCKKSKTVSELFITCQDFTG